MIDETILPTTLTVWLDSSAKPPVLRVKNNGGKNSFGKKSGAQGIRWVLADARLSFVPMTADEPGFQWISAVAGNQPIFGTATIAADGSLNIADTHESIDSEGVWFYLLRATDGNTTYQTALVINRKLELAADEGADVERDSYAKVMVKDNPIIINR